MTTDPKSGPLPRADEHTAPDGGGAREIAEEILDGKLWPMSIDYRDASDRITAAIERERAALADYKQQAAVNQHARIQADKERDQLRAALAASERERNDEVSKHAATAQAVLRTTARLSDMRDDRDRLAAEVERLRAALTAAHAEAANPRIRDYRSSRDRIAVMLALQTAHAEKSR